jgi:NADPH:quinone reductase-like Zn-dependent oxidoreductase
MKAIVQERYGPLEEVLQLREVATPSPAAGQVLVAVRAASVHIGDCHMVRGLPKLFRPLVYGARRPRTRIPGTDIAGVVAAVGPGVMNLAPGDEVLGWCSGAFATHAVAAERSLARKPHALSYDEAAAVGVSAMTALQGLRDHGHLQAGQHLLVVGASGGVGSFAVQIGKALGAEVTGVCSTRNVELVRSMGADHVIDYTTEDFTHGGPRYDLILDNVGAHSLSATRRALKPTGTLLSNGSPVGGWVGGLGNVVRAGLASLVVRQQGRPFVSMPRPEDLAALIEMVEAGRLRPVIDRSVPLSETASAIAYVAAGHNRGTTVITMPDEAEEAGAEETDSDARVGGRS